MLVRQQQGRYAAVMVIKKYSNRRLYDTDDSRYITQDEIATKIRTGVDVRIVDAPSGADITQPMLAQIILESRGASKLLPVPLLYHLIRMGDDALSDFFGRFMTWALQLYLQLRQGISPYNPLASQPVDVLARLLGGAAPWAGGLPGWPGFHASPPPWQPPTTEDPSPEEAPSDGQQPAASAPDGAAIGEEIAALRREMEAMKATMAEQSRKKNK